GQRRRISCRPHPGFPVRIICTETRSRVDENRTRSQLADPLCAFQQKVFLRETIIPGDVCDAGHKRLAGKLRTPHSASGADAVRTPTAAKKHHDCKNKKNTNCFDHCATSWQRQALERTRSEEHTSELQSRENLVCRLLLEK